MQINLEKGWDLLLRFLEIFPSVAFLLRFNEDIPFLVRSYDNFLSLIARVIICY